LSGICGLLSFDEENGLLVVSRQPVQPIDRVIAMTMPLKPPPGTHPEEVKG
jgi:hypothetical protein